MNKALIDSIKSLSDELIQLTAEDMFKRKNDLELSQFFTVLRHVYEVGVENGKLIGENEV